MFLIGDLGFPSLVLVVALVIPVIGLVIRSKWHRAVARQEEIKRLLAFAAEEAARVEYEASISYGAVSVSKAYHQCEVCFAPTTMRCSQCKTVRYCSHKCQYIHWRRGHKDECHRLVYTTLRNNDEKGESTEEERHERLEIGGRSLVKPTKASSGELPLSNTDTFGASLGKEDSIKVECHSDIEGDDCASETFSSAFSGFSSSPSSVESSDDASVCESVSSNEPERTNRPQSVDTELHLRWTASGVNDVCQTDSLSPKFTNLVNSVDKFSKFIKVRPGSGENKCSETIPLDLGISESRESQSAEDSKSSSSHSRTLESTRSRNGGGNKSARTSSSRDGRSNISSDSESTLQFTFNLSENTAPSPCTQGSKVNRIVLNDPVPATTSKDINLEVQSSPSLKREQSSFTDCVPSNVSHVLKSADVELSPKSGNTRGFDLQAVSQGKSINTSNNLKSEKSGTALSSDSSRTSHALNSRDTSCISACANPQSSSGVKVETVPSMKSEKVDVFHGKAATSLYGACPNNKNGFKTSMWKVVDQFRGSKLPKQSHIGSENEVAGKYKDKVLFPYEMFVKLYNWNKVELQPCGLINCGNSCYANVVLQCLAFTPPLTSYFLQGLHSNSCKKEEWCFACEFENLILKAKEGKSVLNPIGILSQLQKIGSQLGNGKEEDAHEFLRYAIDTMQSVCVREAGVHLVGSSEEETTLIGQTFGGYLRSKIQCMKCQGKSERHERMMDLTVEIEGDIGTLEEALRRFSGTEILDGENKYHCSRCKSYEKAKKKLTILEAPNILTIALKRFQSGKFGKLNKSIRFPEILNLAPYMSGTNDRSPVYRLYGVVVHLDVMNASFSGHYVCYVKNAQNKWFKIDDRTVSTSELERVLSKGAYMLLYARCSPRAPRTIRRKIIAPDTKSKPKNRSSDSRSSTHSGSSQSQPSSVPPDDIDSFYSNYQRLQRILEEDSLSDSSSLFSSNSDEWSSSTDSTRYSGSAEDLSEIIFGQPGVGWMNSPWSNSSDCDSPSSSSSRDSDQYTSGSSDPFFHSDNGKHCR